MEGYNQIGAREGSVAAGESGFGVGAESCWRSEGKRCWRLQLGQPGTLQPHSRHVPETLSQPDPQPPGKDSPFLPLVPPGDLSPSGEEMAACLPSLAPPWFVPLVLFQNGEVECSFTPCPELDCPREEWWLGPGQCCYACREPVPMTGKGHPACIPGRTQHQAWKRRGRRLSFTR